MKQIPVIQNPSAASAAVPAGSDTAAMVADPERTAALKPQIVKALSTVFDPEIPVNIYELGLIYDIDVTPEGKVGIRMTLTSPMCPVAGSLPPDVEARVRAVPGVSDAKVEVTWEPPWGPDMMTEAARLQLNMF
jgi:FeS assembly SUF system protein